MSDAGAATTRRSWWIEISAAAMVLLLGAAAWWWIGSEGPEWAPIARAAEAGRWAEAEPMLVAWTQARPDDPAGWELLGRARASLERDDEALAALQRVGPAATNWPRTQALIAGIELERGDLAASEARLREALAKDQACVEALDRLAFVLSSTRRPVEARQVLRRLYRATRDLRPLADSLLVLSVDSEARELGADLSKAIERAPSNPWLRRAWGLTLLNRGRTVEALAYLDEARQRFTNDLVVTFAWAEARMLLNQPVDVSDLGTEPATPREAARWWLGRARIEGAAGRTSEELASLQKAVGLDRSSSQAHYRLGQALLRQGSRDEATSHLEQANTLGIKEDQLKAELRAVLRGRAGAPAYTQIGELCAELGRTTDAREWLRLAASRNPRDESLASLLRSLPENSDTDDPGPQLIERAESTGLAATSSDSPAQSASPIRFVDVAEAAGVAYRYNAGETPRLFIADTMGGGVGVIDYDGDGRLDLYYVNGCPLPYDPSNPPAPNRLYRNLGSWRFEDVTEKAGVGGRGYGMGVAVGDADGDGRDDLFVTGLDATILYRNRGDGTFEDATERAGLASNRWATGAAFADLDSDGDHDLIVITYVAASPLDTTECRDKSGRLIHCQPLRFEAQADHLFRNNGDGTFTDIASEAGFDAPEGRGLGLAVADFDEDGILDVFVANDGTANFLYRGLGDLKFEEAALAMGMAYDSVGSPTASMGVAAADLNADGRIDLFHTNFVNQSSTLRLNLGEGLFADGTFAARLAAPTRSRTGWGTAALDADLDGLLDLFVANGHVDDQPWIDIPMAQRPQFFWGRPAGPFEDVSVQAGPYFENAVTGRGVASADLDDDGRVDLAIVHRDAPAALLQNNTRVQHWIGVKLVARHDSNAVGARVTSHASGRVVTRFATSGTGYLSASEPRLVFGLGETTTVDRLEVRWLSGTTTVVESPDIDRYIEIRE